MNWEHIRAGAPDWTPWAIILSVGALAAVVWAYRQGGAQPRLRALAACLKAAGIVLLALCLIEPLFTGTRPRPGSNLFLVLADNSRSLQLGDGGRQTRGQAMLGRLNESSPWMTR